MPMRRNTIRFNFVHSPELLEELVSRIPNTTSFIQRHGSLLSLVTAKRDQQLMSGVSNCRSISTLDPIDNGYAIAGYDFEISINQAEDEGEEDCEVSGELSRLLQ